MRLLICSATFCLAAGAAHACGPDTDCMIGDRHYRIAMPDLAGNEPVGAILFAHGYRGSAAGVMRNGSLRRMANDLGVALIAAKSGDDDWIIPNAPRHMDSDGAEEFAYFGAVLEDAAAQFGLDRDRVMATGFSAGGMMVWNLACSMPDSFAAFAPISGTFWLRPPESCTAPTASILHIHGDNDPTVPLDGRPILQTHQGKVRDALAMYTEFGEFGDERPTEIAGMGCTEQVNASGDLLGFCLFQGGHSFRTEYVRAAWEHFEAAGKL